MKNRLVYKRLAKYIWVAALLLSAVTMARYTSTVTGGGQAKIAAPVMRLLGTTTNVLNIQNEGNASYAMEVSNSKTLGGKVINSDVAMGYSVLVTVPKTLKLKLVSMVMTGPGGLNQVLPAPTKTESGNNYVYTYSHSKMELPAVTPQTHKFLLNTMNADLGTESKGSVTINIVAEQAKLT